MAHQDDLTRSALGLGEWAYDRGEFVPATAPRLPLSTQGLHYGTGAFEGIRAYRSDAGLLLFRVREHYERLLRACRILRIVDIPHDVDELVRLTVELLRRNGHDGDVYVRPLAHKLSLLPDTPPGVQLAGVSDGLSITTFGYPTPKTVRAMRCLISNWRRPPRDTLPTQAKITAGYATTALAGDEARAAGYDDAILLDRAGNVAEATTANVFAVFGDRVVTPPATGDLLAGITRDSLITLCREAGMEVEERVLSPAELFTADEIFLSSTAKGVAAVVGLSGRDVGEATVGPVTTRAVALYTAATAADGAHPEWLTPVAPHPTPTSGRQG
ncbi:aminotransferase class IV [Streptomyces capitiformicae]|uniref:Branched chain amino acid aminotransferase n=1 Tax=Streptomyces capitiformicae TaxID=2014920 RepID=A0A918YYR1_9ACTN|nr:aminotransferase class IV [Streptomyces capitiformicae]GHE29269.1 branched chain amino acid aminotransferase [Streptomyces capitiformicae]